LKILRQRRPHFRHVSHCAAASLSLYERDHRRDRWRQDPALVRDESVMQYVVHHEPAQPSRGPSSNGTESRVGFSRLRRARTESLGHNINSSDLGRPAPTFLKQQAGCSGAHMLGRYAFSLPDKIARGELRPPQEPESRPGGRLNPTFCSVATRTPLRSEGADALAAHDESADHLILMQQWHREQRALAFRCISNGG
jgi:hypothetical protein